MLQCNFHYHENFNLDQAKALVDRLRAEAAQPPKKRRK
jgi:plasmid stabilization system protein ParE